MDAKTTTEEITLTGIDVFSSTNVVQLSAMRANSVDTCEVDLNLLHSALLANGSPNVRRLVQFLPIVAVANIQGNSITQLEVYHHNLMAEEDCDEAGDFSFNQPDSHNVAPLAVGPQNEGETGEEQVGDNETD